MQVRAWRKQYGFIEINENDRQDSSTVAVPVDKIAALIEALQAAQTFIKDTSDIQVFTF